MGPFGCKNEINIYLCFIQRHEDWQLDRQIAIFHNTLLKEDKENEIMAMCVIVMAD